jgi:hypothetical protein
MKSRRVLTLIVAAGLGLLTCGTVRANLVTNGSFEMTTNGNGQLGYNTNALGWTATGYTFIFAPGTADTTGAPGSIGTDYLWGPGNGSPNGLTISPDGGNFVAADGGYDPGPLSQSINGLTNGEPVTVGFWWAGAQSRPGFGPTTEQWQVSFGSQTQNTPIVNNASEGFTGWQYVTMNFTASGASDVLSFLAAGTPTGEPPFSLLDGVDVEVPEPSCKLLLAGVGVVAAGLSKLRRRARAKSCGA